MDEKQKKPIFKKWWFWILVFIVIIAISSQGNGDKVQSDVAKESVENIGSTTYDESENFEESKEIGETESLTESVTQEEVSGTLSQENAIKMAKSYLEYTAFSKSGLTEQLEFEGFTTEEATYAVDQIGL